MNMPTLSPNLTRQFHRAGLVVRKYSPQILVASGLAGGIYAAVLGAKAAIIAEKEMHPVLQDLREVQDREHTFDTPADYTKALALAYAQIGLSLSKLYGPAVSLGAASIAAILSAHGLLSQRNAALMAGWKLLDEGFREYRGRIVDEFGPEVDERAKYGMTKQVIKTVKKDAKSGKNKTTKTEVNVAPDYLSESMYARMFEDTNHLWKNDNTMNMFLLRSIETYFNQRLQARGHVFLNDVYKDLGLPESKAGQVVGWFLDEEGDNFVDFHLGEADPPMAFTDGIANAILLDFNVDGPIWDLL